MQLYIYSPVIIFADVGTVGFATPPAGILRNNGNSSPATGPRVRFGTATEDDGFFSGPGTETASNPSAPRRHTSFSARSPEPVSSATRSKSPKLQKITINTEESDLQDLFVLAPEVIQVMNDRYGIFILHLPFINLDASLLRCIVTNNGRCAKITVGTPAYLLNPERVAGTKLPGKHHIVKQKIYEVLMRRAESADQPIEHNIFLDLPFEAEPTTSSDLFADKTIKGQVSSCVFARVENSNIVLPNQTISTYVLVFKERVNGFAISKKVQSRGVLNLSSDDDESTSNWGGRKA